MIVDSEVFLGKAVLDHSHKKPVIGLTFIFNIMHWIMLKHIFANVFSQHFLKYAYVLKSCECNKPTQISETIVFHIPATGFIREIANKG